MNYLHQDLCKKKSCLLKKHETKNKTCVNGPFTTTPHPLQKVEITYEKLLQK